ncbi:MAG TPA: hypothetical protein VGN57_14495 [Pirellulaceae bacterium]|jgi:hypothetical protein|nr:hypothetical protein [Pirellulaceae bacterium]
MKAKFSKPERDRLLKASRGSVSDYFTGLTPVERRSRWLPENNRYRVNCVRAFEDDALATPSAISLSQIVTYIAASGPAHAIDGWSFLGRAVDAVMRGDAYAAIHLGYYAELRAAMALLASNGIGVFSGMHCILQNGAAQEFRQITTTKKGKKEYRPYSTHSFVWPCLQHWASQKSSFDLIEKIFKPGGQPLSIWFDRCGAQRPARAVTRQIFRAWGMDLRDVSRDHESRNLVSYRPAEFRPSAPLSASDLIEYISSLWSCFEPQAAGRFPVLERVLLYRALKAGGINALTDAQLTALGFSQQQSVVWKSQFAASTVPTAIADAASKTSIEKARCCLEIISRAALLLSVATASAREHLASAGYTAADLEFFWVRHGEARGLWDATSAPEEPVDAWATIRDALVDCGEWNSAAAAGTSLWSWRQSQPAFVDAFGAFELVAIWGMMP